MSKPRKQMSFQVQCYLILLPIFQLCLTFVLSTSGYSHTYNFSSSQYPPSKLENLYHLYYALYTQVNLSETSCLLVPDIYLSKKWMCLYALLLGLVLDPPKIIRHWCNNIFGKSEQHSLYVSRSFCTK